MTLAFLNSLPKPPLPPFSKGGNLLSPFEKGGLRGDFHCFLTSTQHRTRCPPPESTSSGSSLLHCSTTYLQRGLNMQPSGRSVSLGTLPSMVCSRFFFSSPLGMDWSSPMAKG